MASVDEPSEVRDAAELRVKESDRIAAMVAGLRAIGADVEELHDGWRVRRGEPREASDRHPRRPSDRDRLRDRRAHRAWHPPSSSTIPSAHRSRTRPSGRTWRRCEHEPMRRLRLLTAGESHGPGLSGILEGLPAGLRGQHTPGRPRPQAAAARLRQRPPHADRARPGALDGRHSLRTDARLAHRLRDRQPRLGELDRADVDRGDPRRPASEADHPRPARPRRPRRAPQVRHR